MTILLIMPITNTTGSYSIVTYLVHSAPHTYPLVPYLT